MSALTRIAANPLRLLASGANPPDARTLDRLRCFRVLTTVHLTEFVLDRRAGTVRVREMAMGRIVRRLVRRGLVAGTRRLAGGPGGGSARIVYTLTEMGQRAAATLDPANPQPRPRLRTSLYVEHALMTADIALAFQRAARAFPGGDLCLWESDREASARLGVRAPVPDGRLVYESRAWEVSAFVEADTGTETPLFFGRKIHDYVEAARGGAWREHLRSWPVVLTVTPTRDRATTLRRATERVLRLESRAGDLTPAIRFDFVALTDLQGEPGPLARIYQVANREGLHRLIPADSEDASPEEAPPAPTGAA